MDITSLLTILKSHSFDSDRNKSLSSLIKIINIDSTYLSDILSLYQYDSDRNNALSIIIDKLTVIHSKDLVNIFRHYVYDSDRNKGLSIISKRISSITSNDLENLLSLYQYDSDRVLAIKTIIGSVSSINYNNYINILNNFQYDSDKSKAIPYLTEKLINNKEMITNIEKNEVVKNDKIDFFIFMDTIKLLDDNIKLKTIEKQLPYLNITSIEKKTKDLKKYFEKDSSFKRICEILAINPEIIETVEKEIKLENEIKSKKNELVKIGNSQYHKSYFPKNVTRVIQDTDFTVEITNTGKYYKIMVNNLYGGKTTSTVQLDDEIIIKRSNGNMSNVITMGKVTITI